MLLVRRQRCASSVACPAYNFANFIRTLALPQGSQAVVSDELAGQALQNRCEGCEPRPLLRLPDDRGRGAEEFFFQEILPLIDGMRPKPALA
jgi:hypothetical protein